jgi:hypothetical protein
MDMRLIEIINHRIPEKSRFVHLEQATGINARSWGHAYNQRTRFSTEHIEAISKLFPEYAYWIITGKTIPAHGQTSPDLEQLAELQRRTAHTNNEKTEEIVK